MERPVMCRLRLTRASWRTVWKPSIDARGLPSVASKMAKLTNFSVDFFTWILQLDPDHARRTEKIYPSGSKYTVSAQHNTTISKVIQTLLIAIDRTRVSRLPVSFISDRRKGRCTRGQVVHACFSSLFNHSLLELRKVGIEGAECVPSQLRRRWACKNGPSGRVRV